ncbi:class I SAM-dependent methyltransferase [Natrialba asiatica]|uniref:2-heptaprenyl-1,4-naphthoquinone methyltransferase n=1 Tax=Natrialba asiatica (strain ATCC 700177 / DSM 12278 / JCM 9576 / FERM P-10747 / NBRC 102637 / 172P1) TaxID=29540 RepID=M0AL31_NATA1|nr:methyltransferase domain-containing protein [Natrialba asiatica]ELY98637.1 2-heptaprenyl-1,4-naphthoquinone methyltransferase [Natrialba asiatica DSM 12278]
MRKRTRNSQESKAWYNALSRYYDVLVDPFQGPLRRRGIGFLGVSSDDQILDIGCGTGRGLTTLQNAVGPGGKVVGIDVADRMCQLAQDRVEVDASSAVVCGNALALPFDSDSFDAVLVSFTLELFEYECQMAVLDEIRRVLAPRGKICVIAPSTTASDLVSLLYKRLNDVFPTLVDSRPLDVGSVLARADFEIIQTEMEWVLAVPVELVFARRGPSAGDRS